MICYVHLGKGCSGWQRRSSSGWCKASRSANVSIMIMEFLFELWWRPVTTYDVPECLRQERFAPDEWPDLGLCESYVGWSQHKRTDPGRNKFPKSTSLCHLKPGSHMKLWEEWRWGAIVPNSTSNVLEWKVIMAGFLICQVRIINGFLIDFCECCFRSSFLLLLAFDIIASSRLQRAIPDPNQMSCQ